MAADIALFNLLNELAKTRGMDFRGYKIASLERRLRKRMEQVKISSYDAYVEYLRANRDEVNRLLEVMLINVTHFFRDRPAWDALRREALPLLLDPLRPGDSFRAWCAGCATGEEAYSLAILLSEYFGSRTSKYDIKVYATDRNEDALNVARRGEYSAEAARGVPGDWRDKYFSSAGGTVRVSRALRRRCIFGCNDLVTDAPIPHIQILVCRNVLIYFDSNLQRQVLGKFRYALDNDGVLFLGRSESQLREVAPFRPLSAKWRIFICGKDLRNHPGRDSIPAALKSRQMELARQSQRILLENLRSGVIILDKNHVVTAINEAAVHIWALPDNGLIGKNITASVVAARCPQLAETLQKLEEHAGPVRCQCKFSIESENRLLDLTVRSLFDAEGARSGTLLFADDATTPEKMGPTVEKLKTTADAMHSSHETLETTNEELHPADEELEATNEELRATNEELETTNEELHSLNEALETTNDELEQRTRALEEMSGRYAETLALMPLPIIVVNDNGEIQLWNSESESLFGIEAKGIIGLKLKQLPVGQPLRGVLLKRHAAMVANQGPVVARGIKISSDNFRGVADVRFIPIPGKDSHGVLIVIDPRTGGRGSYAASRAPQKTASNKKTVKHPAAARTKKTKVEKKSSRKR